MRYFCGVKLLFMEKRYLASQRLSDIIEQDPRILLAMSRFGISLGFGDKSVERVCKEQGVGLCTFLAVINFISGAEAAPGEVDLEALISYLENAHDYYLDFSLPMIKRKLVEALGGAGNDELSLLIMRFYDDYVQEVRRHMEYESREVFAYVRRLLAGKRDERYGISMFAEHHHSIHHKLKELKGILIRFLPQRDSNLLNAALFDIINCEQDLMAHCSVEDRLFVPAVRRLEQTLPVADSVPDAGADVTVQPDHKISARERDIISGVAHGLSNKEIADRLCISTATVATHRRNIAQKLNIHSPAGLTIYAVLNGIVKIEELA